jgi:hypothetical protein
MPKISLEGLDKGEVLAALYNASRPLGMGFLHYDPKPMTAEEGAGILATSLYFDYLRGRVMKIDLSGDELEVWLYDRDNGEGAAARVIEELRQKKGVNTESMKASHLTGIYEAAGQAFKNLDTPTTSHEEDMGTALGQKPTGVIVPVVNMGLDDVKDILAPKIAEAVNKAEGGAETEK